LKCS